MKVDPKAISSGRLSERTPWLKVVVLALLPFIGFLLFIVLWLLWGFGVGHEAPFAATTVCEPRDRRFEEARISVQGVVPRHADLAREFIAGVVLLGNQGQQLELQIEVKTTGRSISSRVLKEGSALDPANVLTCFDAVADQRAVLRSFTQEELGAADEFIQILIDSGTGPKGGQPMSGQYFRIVSYSARYTP